MDIRRRGLESTRTTQDIYQHVSPDLARAHVDGLPELMDLDRDAADPVAVMPLVAVAGVAAWRVLPAPTDKADLASGGTPVVSVRYRVERFTHAEGDAVAEPQSVHEFSGSWDEWRDVGRVAMSYEGGVLTTGSGPGERVAAPGSPYSPNDLFNVEHMTISPDEQVVADDADLAAERASTARALGLSPDALKAHRVRERGLCNKQMPGCTDGTLRVLTTVVYEPTARVPVYVEVTENGYLAAELTALSCDCPNP